MLFRDIASTLRRVSRNPGSIVSRPCSCTAGRNSGGVLIYCLGVPVGSGRVTQWKGGVEATRQADRCTDGNSFTSSAANLRQQVSSILFWLMTDASYMAKENWPSMYAAGVGKELIELQFAKLSSFTPSELEWLWEKRIPCRSISIVEGNPGVCKSTLVLDVAARVTNGSPMPQCEHRAEPHDVLLLQSESRPEDIMRTLQAANADLNRVKVIDSRKNSCDSMLLPDMVGTIRRNFDGKRKPRLIVLDPWDDFVPGSTSSRKVVAEALHPLRKLAVEWNAAVIIVRHWGKGAQTNLLHKGLGSIGVIGIARSALAVLEDESEEGVRLVLHHKSNAGECASTLRFKPTKVVDAVALEWIGESPINREKLFDNGGLVFREACSFLRENLAEGPISQKDLAATARILGISEKTLRRAKDALGVGSQRYGFGRDSVVFWCLPEPADEDIQADEAEPECQDEELVKCCAAASGAETMPKVAPARRIKPQGSDHNARRSPADEGTRPRPYRARDYMERYGHIG